MRFSSGAGTTRYKAEKKYILNKLYEVGRPHEKKIKNKQRVRKINTDMQSPASEEVWLSTTNIKYTPKYQFEPKVHLMGKKLNTTKNNAK